MALRYTVKKAAGFSTSRRKDTFSTKFNYLSYDCTIFYGTQGVLFNISGRKHFPAPVIGWFSPLYSYKTPSSIPCQKTTGFLRHGRLEINSGPPLPCRHLEILHSSRWETISELHCEWSTGVKQLFLNYIISFLSTVYSFLISCVCV